MAFGDLDRPVALADRDAGERHGIARFQLALRGPGRRAATASATVSTERATQDGGVRSARKT